MSKSEEYRHRAADCLVMAEQCKDEWSKEVWFETAETWLRLGSQAEETSKRKSPSEEARNSAQENPAPPAHQCREGGEAKETRRVEVIGQVRTT